MSRSRICICVLALFFLCINARAESNEFRRIDQVLDSQFIKLVLDANVEIPANREFPVYYTDYAVSEKDSWLEMFFDNADAEVIDELAENTDQELAEEMISDREREHVYSQGEVFTRYISYDSELYVDYREKNALVSWSQVLTNKQANGLSISIDDAISIAQEWIDRLKRTIGWSGFVIDNCYTMPHIDIEEKGNGYYIVRFVRVLNALSVATDTPPRFDGRRVSIKGDSMEIFIDDEGIFKVRGNIREYTCNNFVKISITLDNAISILRDNMDYVYAFREDNTFVIDQIGLCYRLVQSKSDSDIDVNACTVAKPAWRFASEVNRNMTNQFVMFIDAVTGEVLI